MKKKLILLVMLVSMLALSLTFLSCEEDTKLELNGTTWVASFSKAELADYMDYEVSTLDFMLSLLGGTVNFPIAIMKLEFTSDKDFTMYYNSGLNTFSNTVTWDSPQKGTYTIDGDDVTLKISGYSPYTCPVDGNTLTMTEENNQGKKITLKFKKQ